METPYLVLIKIFKDFSHDEVIESLLNLLHKIYDPKLIIENKKIYQLIDEVVDYFPHYHQWVDDFICIIKSLIPGSSYELINIIATESHRSINKIFAYEKGEILLKNKIIKIVAYDESLLDGKKYIYDGNVLDESLKTLLEKTKKEIINDLIN